MARLDIGPLALLVPEAGGREVTVKDFSGAEQQALGVAAVVVGPTRPAPRGRVPTMGRRAAWWCSCPAGDSSPAFDRLLHGSVSGVKAEPEGTEFVEADLLRWSLEDNWGGSTMATIAELDETWVASAEAMLVEAGCLGFGKRADVLSDARQATEPPVCEVRRYGPARCRSRCTR